MAHGVEARLPFVDYRLVEYVLGLADEAKLSGGWSKRILRDAVNDILPDDVRCRRDKIGFETPELEWMRAGADFYRKRIGEAETASGGVIRADVAIDLFDGMLGGANPYSFVPWRIISFGAWMNAFGVAMD